jgi:hypothetical protein
MYRKYAQIKDMYYFHLHLVIFHQLQYVNKIIAYQDLLTYESNQRMKLYN